MINFSQQMLSGLASKSVIIERATVFSVLMCAWQLIFKHSSVHLAFRN